MPTDDRDIIDLLQDFDRYGNTATERFTMRYRAREEIVRLRKLVDVLKAGYRPMPGDQVDTDSRM